MPDIAAILDRLETEAAAARAELDALQAELTVN